MESQSIKVIKEKHIVTIFLNREHVLNAFNTEMLLSLESTLNEIEVDKNIRVCLLTGSGKKAFSAGADMSEERKKTPAEMFEFCRIAQRICNRLESLPKPVIAVINGYALGGVEIALACDFRVASNTAKFGLPEINHAVTSGWGGSSRLLRIVGISKAKDIAFFGNMITVREALKIGLIDRVFNPRRLLNNAKRMAETLAEEPPFALGLLKLMMNQNNNTNLATGAFLESMGTSLCYSTKDQRERFQAFFKKYRPHFQGK